MALLLECNTAEQLRSEIVKFIRIAEKSERNTAIGERTKTDGRVRVGRANALQSLALDIENALLHKRDDKGIPEEIAADIAKNFLGIDPLQTRNLDSLDFYELSVWNIKAALEAAYKAGKEAQ